MRNTIALKAVSGSKRGLWSRTVSVALVLLAALALGYPADAQDTRGKKDNDPLPFKKTLMRIELNATAGDAGLQFDLDADPWKMLEIEDPKGRTIFSVRSLGQLQTLGNTELFTESNEPPFDELPLKDFLKMFPKGNYEFSGITIDGEELEGVAAFTHKIPCGPEIISPVGDVDADLGVVIEWLPVTHKIDTASNVGNCSNSTNINIVAYEVIVELDGSDPVKSFDIFLPANVTSVTVPAEFFIPGEAYIFEVLAIEAGGNQTISEGGFMTTN
ncbi:MAG: hypothetical protein ACREOP_05820 [Thermodesulfobacteriota bacterium]